MAAALFDENIPPIAKSLNLKVAAGDLLQQWD